MKFFGIIFLLTIGLVVTTTGGVQPHKANNDYEVIKKTFYYASDNRSVGKPTFSSDIYFSQSYFEHSSYEYDPHLATASLCLAISTYTDYPPFTEEWYLTQPKNVKATLESIGFNTFTTNEDYLQTARFDSIGLCAAKKEFSNYTVVAVAPRSGGYFSEWANNMHLGDGSKSDYMHEGWYDAANKLIDFMKGYVNDNQITGAVKLWMTGFSRGGATTNIAAGLIDNKLDKGEKLFNEATLVKEDVYAYTFEAPQGANVNSKTIKAPRDSLYGNIFNVVNPNDVVTKVAMSEYGFTRFGVDKFITTEFYDSANYKKNRQTFKALHDILNQTDEIVYKGDSFRMVGMQVEHFIKCAFIIPAIIDMVEQDPDDFVDHTKANYDANIATTILLEELTSNLGSRDNYVKKYQTPVENLMLVMKDEKLSDMPKQDFIFLRTILSSVLADGICGSFDSIRDSLKEAAGPYANAISDLIDVLLGPLLKVYWERSIELTSAALQLEGIFQNHFSDVNIAHLQAQDSYYIDEYNASHKDKIELVPLRNNADFGRMKFFGFNDLGLRLESKNGKRVVNVEGHILGKSDVKTCNGGYAVGYYSYITEEKMELFMPINAKYNISMKSYSKKPRHRVEYWAYYQFIALDNRGVIKVRLDHKKATAYFNSDRYKRDVTIKL